MRLVVKEFWLFRHSFCLKSQIPELRVHLICPLSVVKIIGVLRGNRFSKVLRLAMGFRVSDGKMVFSEKKFGARYYHVLRYYIDLPVYKD